MKVNHAREAFKFYLPQSLKLNKIITKKVGEQEINQIFSSIGIDINSAYAVVHESENFCFSFKKLNYSEWLVTIKPL